MANGINGVIAPTMMGDPESIADPFDRVAKT